MALPTWRGRTYSQGSLHLNLIFFPSPKRLQLGFITIFGCPFPREEKPGHIHPTSKFSKILIMANQAGAIDKASKISRNKITFLWIARKSLDWMSDLIQHQNYIHVPEETRRCPKQSCINNIDQHLVPSSMSRQGRHTARSFRRPGRRWGGWAEFMSSTPDWRLEIESQRRWSVRWKPVTLDNILRLIQSRWHYHPATY